MGKIYKALQKSQEETGDTKNQEIDSDIDKWTTVEHEKDINESPTAVHEKYMSESPPVEHDKGDVLSSSSQPHDTDSDNLPLTSKCNLDSSIVTHYKPHSFESEQFRLLKTTILFPDKGEPPRTIMVTSTAPGEGKSFVAANLAVTLANSIDEYVLLIDCALRHPSIHKLFGFPDNTPGLSEYLTHKLPLSGVLLRNVIDKLTILPCGSPSDNPSELLSSEQMRRLITEVKTRYDDRYIIIDSPPPYITAEANALARQVDAIIIVVKTGKTRRENLRDLVDTYGKDKILGIVKNFDQPILFSKTKYNYRYNT